MPLIHIHIADGKTIQQKQDMMLAVTEAVEKTLGTNRQGIRVFVHETPRSHIMVAGAIPGNPAPPEKK